MATGNIYVNGDVLTQWAGTSGWCTETYHFECIDDHSSPSMTDQIRAEDTDDGNIEEFNMTSISGIAGYTQVVLWTYGIVNAAAARPTCSVNGATPQTCVLPTGVANWTNNTFTVSGNQADLDNITIEWTAPTLAKFDVIQIGATYAVVTYTEPATGPSNIAKINGVAIANIAKFNGVPITDISKINGIT